MPPQLRAKGRADRYFDLYLSNRVGTRRSRPTRRLSRSGSTKLFDAAPLVGVHDSLDRRERAFGAQPTTPWTATTAQSRANVLAYLQRARGEGRATVPAPLEARHTPRPGRGRLVALGRAGGRPRPGGLTPQGLKVSAQGAVRRQPPAAGDECASRMEDPIEIGVPTVPARTDDAHYRARPPTPGGREGLRGSRAGSDAGPSGRRSASRQGVAAELQPCERLVVGLGGVQPGRRGNDPDKPKAACAWLWTRDHALCDAPALAGQELLLVARRRRHAPSGTPACWARPSVVGERCGGAASTGRTGDRDLAYSAELEHAVLAEASRGRPEGGRPGAVTDTILDHFGGSRSAYLAALARRRRRLRSRGWILRTSAPAGRSRRRCGWPAPTQAVGACGGTTRIPRNAGPAGALRPSASVPRLGNRRTGIAVTRRLRRNGSPALAAAGATVKIDGVQGDGARRSCAARLVSARSRPRLSVRSRVRGGGARRRVRDLGAQAREPEALPA